MQNLGVEASTAVSGVEATLWGTVLQIATIHQLDPGAKDPPPAPAPAPSCSVPDPPPQERWASGAETDPLLFELQAQVEGAELDFYKSEKKELATFISISVTVNRSLIYINSQTVFSYPVRGHSLLILTRLLWGVSPVDYLAYTSSHH